MTVRRPEPAAIDYKGRRFLITDRPNDGNMTRYIQVRKLQCIPSAHVAVVTGCPLPKYLFLFADDLLLWH